MLAVADEDGLSVVGFASVLILTERAAEASMANELGSRNPTTLNSLARFPH
jgi:hypothetical protein